MIKIYIEGPALIKHARDTHMDVDILQRQQSGHYTVNHDAYHKLGVDHTPCRGYGNWILFRTDSVLAPGFKSSITKSTTGGSLIEGVLVEWITDPGQPSSWEATTLRHGTFNRYVTY